MEGLFGDCSYILNSATDHFISSLKISEKRYFRLSKLGELTNISIRIVAVINLGQRISDAYFIAQHLYFFLFK